MWYIPGAPHAPGLSPHHTTFPRSGLLSFQAQVLQPPPSVQRLSSEPHPVFAQYHEFFNLLTLPMIFPLLALLQLPLHPMNFSLPFKALIKYTYIHKPFPSGSCALYIVGS